MICLLVLKGFFSGCEIAMVSADKVKLNALAGKGHKGSRMVLDEFRSPEILLGTTLVGTNVATIVLTWLAAIPIGIYSAVRHHSVEDYTLTFLGFLGLAIPDFLLALMLMWIGFFYFDFSVGGLFTREYAGAHVPWTMGKVVDLLSHLWIPAIVLGTSGTAAIIRIMRANLLDELSKPYVVTARAKGLHEWKAVMKYPVRVALNPILSLSAYIFPVLISGSIIVSVVLGLPTVGPLLLRALLAEDLFMASSIVNLDLKFK